MPSAGGPERASHLAIRHTTARARCCDGDELPILVDAPAFHTEGLLEDRGVCCWFWNESGTLSGGSGRA